jgi:dsDNA-specific endonuclease/ATPase MutS2
MTFTVSDIMLTVIALSLAACAVQLLRIWGRLGRTATEVENASRRVGELEPRLERVLDELSGELRELRSLTRRTDAVVSDVQAVSGEIRRGVEIVDLTRRTRAAVAGARAGLAVLGRSQPSNNGEGVHDGQ